MRLGRLLALLLLAAACGDGGTGGSGGGGGSGSGGGGGGPPGQVTVDNLTDGTELRHRLAFLSGTVASATTSVSVIEPGGTARSWPAAGGRFKALVPLVPGDNALQLDVDGVRTPFTLKYRDSTNPRFVRIVYLVAADDVGTFDGPSGEPNDQASAVARLRLAAELMQTFTAEKLNAQGLGRQTFRLDRDANGDVKVEVFKSTLTMAQAHAMDGNALWSHFYGALANLPQRNDSIDVAVMGMTRYVPATQTALAHTALGGGRLGLFGSGTLHTYASTLDQLVARWSDARTIDTTKLFDDSGNRHTYWANYATGIGATLHELGHCLSLPHPANGIGVMSRQFDWFNRAFMVNEPGQSVPVTPAQEAVWDRSAAVRLRFHRWLAPDARTYAVNAEPVIATTATALTVSSAAGIRHVAYLVNGNGTEHDEQLTSAPNPFSATLASLKTRLSGAASMRVTAIDDDGNIAEKDVTLP